MTRTAGFERTQTTEYPGVANCLVQQVFWGMPPTIDHAGTQPSCILVVGALEKGNSRAGGTSISHFVHSPRPLPRPSCHLGDCLESQTACCLLEGGELRLCV